MSLGTFEAKARDGMLVQREVAFVWRFGDDLFERVEAYASWKDALEAAGLQE